MQIKKLKTYVPMTGCVPVSAASKPGPYVKTDDVLAREQAALAELKKGWKA